MNTPNEPETQGLHYVTSPDTCQLILSALARWEQKHGRTLRVSRDALLETPFESGLIFIRIPNTQDIEVCQVDGGGSATLELALKGLLNPNNPVGCPQVRQ